MVRLFFLLVVGVEIFAFANRGGGPLFSYLFLTGATFLAVSLLFFQKEQPQFKFGAVEAGYGLFFIFFLFSFLLSKAPGFGLSELLLFASAGVLFWIFSNLKYSKKDLDWFFVAMIALAVADTLIGFFIYTKTPFPRLVGTFIDLAEPYASFANDYANYILVNLPLAASLLLRRHQRKTTSVLAMLSFAILLAGFLLSFSRGAWVSFAVLSVLFAIWYALNRKRISQSLHAEDYLPAKKSAPRILISISIVLILILGLQTARSQRFETTSFFKKASFSADEGTASASERLDFWQGAAKVIRDNPVFGGGVYSFKFLYPKYQKEFGINWGQPHNLFLKMGSENGIPAAIFFGLFLGAIGILLLKFLWKNPVHPALWLLAGSLGAFGHNLIDFNFIVGNFAPFIVFLAIAFSHASPERKTLSLGRPALAGLLIFASAFLALGFHEGFYNIDFKKGRAELADKKIDSAVFHLERTQKLFFQRDLPKYLGAVYDLKYKETGDRKWREKEKTLLAAQAENSHDAAVYSRLAEIAAEEKNSPNALSFAQRALELDPRNSMKYYFQVAQAGGGGANINKEFRQTILAVLEEYELVLKQNRHFTVLTENPRYASRLLELLGMRQEKEKLDRIWFEELLKFAIRYGPPLDRSII